MEDTAERIEAQGADTDAAEPTLLEQNRIYAERLAAAETETGRLARELAIREADVSELELQITELEARLGNVTTGLAEAVAGYKALVIETNPGVLAELITGTNVDEVNQSLANARLLVERVRQEMEAEVSRTRVPAGAPARSAPDYSALSARQKIQYAIGGNS